uniref:exodeoxyribonuclease III n=1 Tax=Seriola lalandi dorsalis TaxID=1841481 RepID=A0A3B4WAI3_SERLL
MNRVELYINMSDLKITSLNVKGLNHVIKRQKILTLFKKEKCHIAFLQETHLTDLEHIKVHRNLVGQVFHSSFKYHSQGVAILLHRSLPFTLDKAISDKEGLYVLISGYLFGEHILLGCIYAPSTYESAFFHKLLADISDFSSSYILIGGDFNCISNPTVDQCPSRPFSSRKSLKLVDFAQI